MQAIGMTDLKRYLAVAIVQFLHRSTTNNTLEQDDAESFGVVIL